MATGIELTIEERVYQLFRHLGIQKAHIAGRQLQDWKGILTTHPEIMSSLTLVCPLDIDDTILPPIASNLCLINGAGGPFAERAANIVKSLPGVYSATLSDFTPQLWTDVAVERTDEILAALTAFLGQVDDAPGGTFPQIADGEGECAGIFYRVQGAGPVLVLLPLALAPSQWEPLIPALSQRFCTVTLSGSELGFPAILESRGRSIGYVAMLRSLIDQIELEPGEEVLDIGCGTGVVDRWLARHTMGENLITGVERSPYFLREAATLVERDGVGMSIQFKEGDAESIPFINNSFDVSISCTVMEEGDADKMLSEMVRVTKPGGRVGAIVRAMDMAWWINIPLRTELKEKVNAPRGAGRLPACDDSSLYSRFRKAGLSQVKMYPYMAAFQGLIAEFYLERTYLTLSADEASEWRDARERAEKEGTLFIAQPFHCAVGLKS